MHRSRLSSTLSALRFSRGWTFPPTGVTEREVSIPGRAGHGAIRSSVFESAPDRRGWVVLHGMTRMGRSHPELVRFARALASTGGRVLAPEIPEWRELSFAPTGAQAIIEAAVAWLAAAPGVRAGGVVLVGFSFGAPQALIAASRPEVSRRLRGVVGWGGFADLERTFRFAFLGRHEWEGRSYVLDPDPYVRWVIGCNCLPFSDRLDGDGRVVRALHTLAVAAGERRIDPGRSNAAALEGELAAGLTGDDRRLFRLFASCGNAPDPDAAEAVVSELIPLARRNVPLLDPLPAIDRIEVPVRLMHPRSDRLIPFTESLRLAHALETRVSDLKLGITGLFSHAGRDATGGVFARTWENVRFLNALRSVFEVA